MAGGRAVCRPAAGPGPDGDAAALNRAYLDHRGGLLPPAGGSVRCAAPGPRCTLAIVTNGVAAPSSAASRHPPERPHPWLFISRRSWGASKPDSAFLPRCSVHWESRPPAGWMVGTTSWPISRGASRPGWTRLGTIRAGCPATPPSSPPGRWTDTRRSSADSQRRKNNI